MKKKIVKKVSKAPVEKVVVNNQKGIVPLADRVLLKDVAFDATRKTESGIYIPDTVKEDRGAKKATVVAVGPGRIEDGKRTPVSVSVGDTVLYQWGDKISFDGEEYILAKENDIVAVIK